MTITKAGQFSISTMPGGYIVLNSTPRKGIVTHIVGKDKRCSCGGTARRPCRHIGAVKAYLREGGDLAPEIEVADESQEIAPRTEPETCPICGSAVVVLDVGFWRCLQDCSHYWQHRGERSGVKAFLTQSHPAKQGAFYAMSIEERDAFLAAAQQRMHEGGYTPWA